MPLIFLSLLVSIGCVVLHARSPEEVVLSMIFLILFFILIYFGVRANASRRIKSQNSTKYLNPDLNFINDLFSKRNPFFNTLSLQEKDEFIKTVIKFLNYAEISADKKFKLTIEMEYLIGATFVQLTFGMKNYFFDHFNRIVIHETSYYNRLTKKYHDGEVNLAGVIVLSWDKFMLGYENYEDKVNLGLHEMAHALFFEIIKCRNTDVAVYEILEKIILISEIEIKRHKFAGNYFLRKYAYKNSAEFFAVSIEYFFEAPIELKMHYPELYRHLVKLLEQDPVGIM